MSSKAFGLAQLGNAFNDGALSNRNLIINGAMQVAQRGTSFTEAESEAYGVDRFKYQRSGTSGRVTLSQGDGLAGVSPKSVKIEVTTAAAATPPSDVFHQYRYPIEGNDVDHLGLGTADCKELTLSFYAKASTTGTLPFALGNVGGTKTYPNTFNISTADTWQRYVYKIPAVTDGSWASGTGSGLDLRIGFEYGSDYTGGTVGQWATTSAFANFAPTYTNPLASTLNATLQITGVQLEVGDTATPFEHRSYGQELALCQRYYQRSVQTVGTTFGYGDSDIASARCVNGNWLMDNLGFKTTMRANPTFRNSDNAGAVGKVMRSATGLSITLGLTCKLDGEVRAFPGGNVNTYESVQFSWDADAEL